MAKKHFLIPARLTRKYPALRNLIWRFEASIVKSLVALMKTMSPERAARFGNFLFRNLKPVLPMAKKIRRNLTVAFPEKDAREIERITRKTCGNLGNVVAELVMAERIWAERDQRVEFVLEDGINLSDYRNRPAVIVSGHIGAWEIITFIAAHHQLRITSVYAPDGNPYLRDFLVQLRAAQPCKWIAKHGCMRGLMKDLKQGHFVGLLSDTRLDGGDSIPFFGVPTPSNTAAARLAIRNNCDFFPARAERLPGMRFRITLCSPIRPEDPNSTVANQAQQMTRKLFEYFETWIRENPDQWMCFSQRWPHEAYAEDL